MSALPNQSDDVASVLQELRDEQRDYPSHRDALFVFLSKTMATVERMRLCPESILTFYDRFWRNDLPLKMVKPETLTRDVIAYVTDARSESDRKIAWKRARALDYLHDECGIKAEALPDAFRDRGGLEAVVREAVKSRPLRNSGRSSSEKTAADVRLARQKKLLTIFVRSSLRREILEADAGCRLQLIAIRSTQQAGHFDLEIRRIIRTRPPLKMKWGR